MLQVLLKDHPSVSLHPWRVRTLAAKGPSPWSSAVSAVSAVSAGVT